MENFNEDIYIESSIMDLIEIKKERKRSHIVQK